MLKARIWCLMALGLALLPSSAGAVTQAEIQKVCLLDGKGSKSLDMPVCTAIYSGAGTQSCYNTLNAGSNMWGVRLNPNAPGAKTPIDLYNKCRYLDNTSTDGYFVPFKTSEEWTAFLNNPPPGVDTTANCARYFQGKNASYGLRYGPTSTGATYAVSLPYARKGATWPPTGVSCTNTHTFTLTCTENYYSSAAKACATKSHSWKEVWNFTAQATGSVDNKPAIPGWKGKSVKIAALSQTKPAACSNTCVIPTPPTPPPSTPSTPSTPSSTCAGGLTEGATKSIGCLPYGTGWLNGGSCCNRSYQGVQLYPGNYGSHMYSLGGSAIVKCSSGKLSLVTSCKAANGGK